MKFEVFIPGKTADDFDITLKIKAASWLEALKAGLSRMGEDSGLIKHILIDIMEDNTIHVTETVNGRVFRIKELEEEVSQESKLAEEARVKAEAEAKIKLEIEARVKAEVEAKLKAELEAKIALEINSKNTANETDLAKTQKIKLDSIEVKNQDFDSDKKESSETTPTKNETTDETLDDDELELKAHFEAKLKAEKESLDNKKELLENKKEPLENKKESLDVKNEIPPVQTKKVDYEIEEIHKQQATQKIFVGRSEKVKEIDIDAILSELYFDISDIDSESNISAAMEIAMDLSMKYIECDSGSLYLVDLNKNDIFFSAIRGPKAEELKKLNIRIPMGIGIVGFCAEEDVSLAISDVNRDPRFYRAISQKLGYPTYSILCVPMHKNGRIYGAIQLINKHGSNTFTPGEVGVIDYICNHVAEYLERKINRYY